MPNLSAITEANYFARGWKSNSGDDNNRYDYFNLSLLLKPRIVFSKITPYLLAGLEADWLLNIFGGYSFVKTNKHYGLVIGLGTEFERTGYGVLAECIYDLYLDDIHKDALIKIRSQTVSLRIGVFLK